MRRHKLWATLALIAAVGTALVGTATRPGSAADTSCTIDGRSITWTVDPDVVVQIRSVQNGWLATRTGPGTYTVPNTTNDYIIRTRTDGSTITNTPCQPVDTRPANECTIDPISRIYWSGPGAAALFSTGRGWLTGLREGDFIIGRPDEEYFVQPFDAEKAVLGPSIPCVPTPFPEGSIQCWYLGNDEQREIYWRVEETAEVSVFSTAGDLITTATGSGSVVAPTGVRSFYILVQNEGGPAVTTSCDSANPPIRSAPLIRCTYGSTFARFTVSLTLPVEVRSNDGLIWSGAGTDQPKTLRFDEERDGVFLRLERLGEIIDYPCDPDFFVVSCTIDRAGLLTWTTSKPEQVFIRSVTDGWLATQNGSSGSYEVDDLDDDYLIRMSVDPSTRTDYPCEKAAV